MHLVYTENRDTKHIIDLQKVLITSFDIQIGYEKVQVRLGGINLE